MNNNYPEVTKNNFDEFVKKHVSSDKNSPRFINIDIPKNEAEFRAFTKSIYGVELGVECRAYSKVEFNRDYSCQYRVTGMSYEEYSQMPIMKLWENKFRQYNGLSILLDSCFGDVSCGGVAGTHYGQTKCDEETWTRVNNWSK